MADTTWVFRDTGRGRSWFRRNAKGNAVEGVVEGFMDAPLARAYQGLCEEALDAWAPVSGGARTTASHDGSGASGYDPEYSLAWQRWLRHRGREVALCHFLTDSRILPMAITVANLALPDTRRVVHEGRAKYLAARLTVLPATTLPAVQPVT